MGVDIASFLVQQQLLQTDRVIIRLKTIREIAKQMIEDGMTIDSNSLYLNCIIDGIHKLVEYDQELNNTSCNASYVIV